MKVLVACLVTVLIAAGLARAEPLYVRRSGDEQQSDDVLKFQQQRQQQQQQYEGLFGSESPNFCPDKSICPKDQTCCRRPEVNTYQCCPYKNGFCCPDNIHCCPHGYKCEVIQGSTTCMENSLTTRRKRAIANDFPCPDGSQCPAGNTCCSNQKGGYTCCPHPVATCCADNLHCCPNGYTCDSGSENCTLDDSTLPATMRPSSPLPKVADVICPDQSRCPSETSCCPLPNGKYGCCPYMEAVCCSNNKNCCPRGYKCDDSSEKCLKPRGGASLPAAVKLPSIPAGDQSKVVVCPDHRECPDGFTCCLGANKAYECCPHKEATCCSDKKHCCPHGYRCDSTGSCYRGGVRIQALAKLPSRDPRAQNDVICPDQSICPGKSTCCKADGAGYGCCKFENGVCCLDGKHCCPTNYTCDAATATCKTEDVQLLPNQQLENQRKKTRLETINHDQICNDGTRCEPKSKCCWIAETNRYGCCKFERGICCKNGCCDEGYRCVDGGLCDPIDAVVTSFIQRLLTVKQTPLY